MSIRIPSRRYFLQLGLGVLTAGRVSAMQLRRESLDAAMDLIERFVDQGKLRSASLTVRRDETVVRRGFGKAQADTVFLIASITKPMTAAGVMILVDRGELQLSNPVSRLLPEFAGEGRGEVTLQHLLTHTSGLPDQLPENVELRKKHSPLEGFVEKALRTPLLFRPGTRVSYQSMGFLLAAEICRKVTGLPFAEFLQEELFRPLGMNHTALGLGHLVLEETAQCQIAEAPDLYGRGDDAESWNWNSRYWRNLAAPWGGAHSSGPDLEKFLRYFLNPADGPLSVNSARRMVTDQNQGLSTPWGLGFRLGSSSLGRNCSPRTFGHTGSTGTLAWADPATGTTCVLLTTLPAEVSRKTLIEPVSDLVGQADEALRP